MEARNCHYVRVGSIGLTEPTSRNPPGAFSALGLELDLTLGRQTPDTDDDVWVDCGATLSTPVGFFRPEIPWDHDGPVHQYDPDETSEDV